MPPSQRQPSVNADGPRGPHTLPLPYSNPDPEPERAVSLAQQRSSLQSESHSRACCKLSSWTTEGSRCRAVEISITWSAGEEHFFTGFKPEISAGLRRLRHAAGHDVLASGRTVGCPRLGTCGPRLPAVGGQTTSAASS